MGYEVIDFIPSRWMVLLVAGSFAFSAIFITLWLIGKHLMYLSKIHIQSKIVGILWMVPIYSFDSFLSLWVPSIASYVNMLRDCYEV